MENVQRCLADIKGKKPAPMVAIEPIDSPASSLEDEAGLARNLITALLNVYISKFQPSFTQLIDVRLSIPWHRYDMEGVEYPQKLDQYFGYITWKADDLRGFINKRIQWEFDRVGRGYVAKGGQDQWRTLFGPTHKNEYCTSPVSEDSFNYVLRHTHYRPRDIIRIARTAVEIESGKDPNLSPDDIVKGRGGAAISQQGLSEAVRQCCRSGFEIRLTEAKRKFPYVKTIINELYGIHVPCTYEELDKRIKNAKLPTQFTFQVVVGQLWDAGILGVMLEPRGEKEWEVLKLRLEDGFRSYYSDDRQKYERWYLFEYNYPRPITELINTMKNQDGIEMSYVLHPLAFEHLSPITIKDCPVGA